jgi:L-threonylcarbamoyladenylate synthase
MALISSDIKEAAKLLSQEEVVAIPTETVYGLAGNIFSENAIKGIFEMKKRPLFNPLIVHIKSMDYLDKVAQDIPENAYKLADKFWPGPLTMVLPKKDNVPDLVTAGKKTVGVRIPDHPTVLALLELLDFPLAAPSANPFGNISPTKAEHVANYFKDQLKMVLDGGDCSRGIESTIVGFKGNDTIVYRLGSVSVEELEAVVGKVSFITKDDVAPEAPGMMSRHYAPKTTTYLTGNVSGMIPDFKGKKIGVLLLKDNLNLDIKIEKVILSKNGDLKEAAKNLYEALHQLDKMNLDVIIAEKMPDVDLGKSINDRLARATKK